jgi:REP element-mobilizing transposase RayT
MPFYYRVNSPGELQFITTSTYRRTPLFLSERFRRCFVRRLDEVRQEWHFLLIGWVLTPERFHVLIKPEPAETTPLIMKGPGDASAIPAKQFPTGRRPEGKIRQNVPSILTFIRIQLAIGRQRANLWCGELGWGEMPQGEFKVLGTGCQAKAIGRRQAGGQGLRAGSGIWASGSGLQVGRGWESLN